MKTIHRRKIFTKLFRITGILLLVSCKGQDRREGIRVVESCDDLSGLPEDEILVRKSFGYVAQTPVDESNCKNCNLWIPPRKGEKCGGCTLFKGPVFDEAYCTYWAPLTN